MNKRKLLHLPILLTIAAILGCQTSPERSSASDSPSPDSFEGVVETGEEAAAELVATPKAIGPGGSVTLQIENHGQVGLHYGRPITVEHWDGAEWIETEGSRNVGWTMELLYIPAGETGVEQIWPFFPGEYPEPGWYRFTKLLHAEATSGDSPRLILRARVEVETP